MARLIDSIRGHEKQIQTLLESAASSRFPQTLLLTGPHGIGKSLVAWATAQALACENSPAPCGHCGPCQRVEKKQSESVLYIAPEKTGIKIEQARDITRFSQLRTVGRAKVIIIDDAHELTAQSANALLKTLEEPPQDTYFILIAPSSSSVIPTIRSRTQCLRFSPLSAEALQPNSDIPEWVVRSSQGRMDRLALLSDPENLEMRRTAISLFFSPVSETISTFTSQLKDALKDKGAALIIMSYYQQFLRDLMALRLTEQTAIHTDLTKEYKTLDPLSNEDIDDLFAESLRLKRDIDGHVDKTLSFEEFWFSTSRALTRHT